MGNASTLHEGYIIPPFGRGGIWHFNENYGNIAYDSSDNFNSFVYDSYYYLITQSDPSLPGAWLTAGKKCFDCTKRGGVNDIPDFW